MKKDSRRLILAVAAYSGASILGPMLLLGAAGFFLDKYFGSAPKFLLISIGIAFVVSNVLLFRKQRSFPKSKVFKETFLEKEDVEE